MNQSKGIGDALAYIRSVVRPQDIAAATDAPTMDISMAFALHGIVGLITEGYSDEQILMLLQELLHQARQINLPNDPTRS